jgi:hypothetical protein
MQNFREEHSKEFLENFIQGDEQMMTAVSRHATEDEAELQSGKMLEEARDAPAGELEEANLSEGKDEQQQLSNETTELESAAEWKIKATRDEEDNMGGLIDLPICREEVQPRRLHQESQPLEQLEEVIEEIKRLMLRSAQEFVSKEKLNRGKPAIAEGKQQQQQ